MRKELMLLLLPFALTACGGNNPATCIRDITADHEVKLNNLGIKKKLYEKSLSAGVECIGNQIVEKQVGDIEIAKKICFHDKKILDIGQRDIDAVNDEIKMENATYGLKIKACGR